MTNASNKPDTRMQSLWLRTAILNSKSSKITVGGIHSLVPGQNGVEVVKQRQQLQCRKQSISSKHHRTVFTCVEAGSQAQAIKCDAQGANDEIRFARIGRTT